ncbi:hypothetical protein BDV28DRAFT_127310 [Aspergillus coremiiformis]|uniref:Uncharacterized protein n=1 Tax=Aspergillus coremiiformis TaxID=138285 RepID=A0A5N6ZHM8_9EURO|nr:hypothetical protein BDV28DRAFT_127310 [Aspergillus coremiiformis]
MRPNRANACRSEPPHVGCKPQFCDLQSNLVHIPTTLGQDQPFSTPYQWLTRSLSQTRWKDNVRHRVYQTTNWEDVKDHRVGVGRHRTEDPYKEVEQERLGNPLHAVACSRKKHPEETKSQKISFPEGNKKYIYMKQKKKEVKSHWDRRRKDLHPLRMLFPLNCSCEWR